MAKHTKQSVIPIYLGGVVWLVFGLGLRLYQPVDYILCAVISLAAFVVGKAIFPDRDYQLPGESEQEARKQAEEAHAAREKAQADREAQERKEQERRAQQSQQAKPAAPVLRSLAAQHGGMAVPLHHQPVQVGRDSATCRLVYRDDTPGVSSHHCQVFFDEREQVFVVTDLHSSYCTFLAGGQRLAPDVPTKLPPKSSIYLGEVENTIYLDVE